MMIFLLLWLLEIDLLGKWFDKWKDLNIDCLIMLVGVVWFCNWVLKEERWKWKEVFVYILRN